MVQGLSKIFAKSIGVILIELSFTESNVVRFTVVSHTLSDQA